MPAFQIGGLGNNKHVYSLFGHNIGIPHIPPDDTRHSQRQQNPTHIYTTPGIYDVKLIANTRTGCSDSLIINSMIRVNGPITGFMASDTAGCAPVSVQFTDTSFNAITWQWSFGDGSASTDINPKHVYNDPGQYTVSLITYDSIGCQSVFTYPYNFTISEKPVASFIVSDTVGCVPTSITFINTSQGFDSLMWHFGDGNIFTNDTSVTYIYTVAGIYFPYLVAFNNEGCVDTFYLNQAIHIILQPDADFTASDDRGCAPLDVNFTNQSSSVQNGTSYLWDFGNGDTSTLQNLSYTYQLPGIYSVTLTVTNMGLCSSTMITTALIQVFDLNPPPQSPILRVSVIDDSRVEILLGEPFMAETALEVGLVNRVVPPAECNALAQAQARKLAAKPLSALIETKRLMKAGQASEVQARMQEEGASFARLMAGPAAKEAFTAFMQKRKPDFSSC